MSKKLEKLADYLAYKRKHCIAREAEEKDEIKKAYHRGRYAIAHHILCEIIDTLPTPKAKKIIAKHLNNKKDGLDL